MKHTDEQIADMIEYIEKGNGITLRKGHVVAEISLDNIAHLDVFLRDGFVCVWFY